MATIRVERQRLRGFELWWSDMKEMNLDGMIELFCGLFIFLLIIILPSMSFKSIEQEEYGVAYDIHQRKLSTQVQGVGLHSGPPGFKFLLFPKTIETVNVNTQCVAEDGLYIQADVSLQYVLRKELIVDSLQVYNSASDLKSMIAAAAKSSVAHACGEKSITQFQNDRLGVQSSILNEFREKIEPSGADLNLFSSAVSVQLRNLEIPVAYSNAVSAKQRAAEEIDLAENQRVQIVTEANTLKLNAVITASEIVNAATSDADIRIEEASYKANATLLEFSSEAAIYTNLITSLNLTSEGFLSYMGTRLVESKSQVSINGLEPAKLSYREDLA